MPNFANLHTGSKIKLARTMKGLTQEQLADKIHKTRALVAHIEKSGKVNYYTYQSICKALALKPEELEKIEVGKIYSSKTAVNPKELDFLNRENKLLKDLVESKQSQINLLQEELGKYKRKRGK